MPNPKTAEIEQKARDLCMQYGCDPDVVLAINPSTDGAPPADMAVPAWWHFKEQAELELASERR